MAMKVLNWLHRKVQAKEDHYCPISSKKDEIKEDLIRESVAERDTEALLLHDILLNGILSIGTLGHHQTFLPEGGLVVEEKEQILHTDEGENKPQELEQPALVATQTKAVSRAGSVKIKSASMKESEFDDVMEVVVKKVELEEYRVSIQEKPLLMNYEEKREKARTTLAELFAAEVLEEKDHKEQSCKGDSVMKSVSEVKFSEDEMEKKKEKSSTNIRTLNRLLRKMLRKKIHPEHPSRRSDEGPLLMRSQPPDTSN